MKTVVQRNVARTVLLIGEGDAEELLLRHLKALFVFRGSGVAVTIKNARGKGAQHVVDFAIRQSRNADYDDVLALFDTDAAWTEQVRTQARRRSVQLLPCEPCLEALLLQAFGHKTQGFTSQQLKQKFLGVFGRPAHNHNYLRSADALFFEAAQHRAPGIGTLLALLRRSSSSMQRQRP